MSAQDDLPASEDFLLKHVNAVALMPLRGSRRISLLGRRFFNVLLQRAHDAGKQDEYTARLHEIAADAGFESKNYGLIRQTLRELMGTTVEWQSPTNGENEDWEACVLLSGAGTRKDLRTGAVTVFWRYDSKVRDQLLSPDRYARLSLEAITQLSTHAALALYEICARYVDNPGHKTARQNWRWWKPVLTGVSGDDSKAEYRFFKRDVINKAIAEINALTNLQVTGPIEYKERDNKTIGDIQFEVRLKGRHHAQPDPEPLRDIDPAALPTIGRAILAGVKQAEAENLVRRHGAEPMAAAVSELEARLQMPTEKVGQVAKPGAWLRAAMDRKEKTAAELRVKSSAPPPAQDVIKKHRAAWTDEWLRRRKEGLRKDFLTRDEAGQHALLASFREELKATSQLQFVKRLDSSGWEHRMVRDLFTKFLGLRHLGVSWDKPTPDDILAIAAELAAE